MGNALMNQGAMKNGAMLFHLTARATGRSTHAGLLEFTGPEGTILLPSKVCVCVCVCVHVCACVLHMRACT